MYHLLVIIYCLLFIIYHLSYIHGQVPSNQFADIFRCSDETNVAVQSAVFLNVDLQSIRKMNNLIGKNKIFF